MIKKKNSMMSKGWLIVGIVMIVAGLYLVFIANSLYSESNLIKGYSDNNAEYLLIKEATNRILVSVLFLVITSLIIIAIGAIMCVEWVSFSKFIRKYAD